MINLMYQHREAFKQAGVHLHFTGPVSQDLLEDIVNIVRKQMTINGVQNATVMRVFAVAVELLQNLIWYSAETIPIDCEDAQFRIGTLVVGEKDGQYFVTSGNLICRTNIDALQKHLGLMEGMTQEELRRYYKEVRRKPRPPEHRKGAGLGLLEVAKKSSRPLEFSFYPVDERFSFFSLTAIIDGIVKSP